METPTEILEESISETASQGMENSEATSMEAVSESSSELSGNSQAQDPEQSALESNTNTESSTEVNSQTQAESTETTNVILNDAETTETGGLEISDPLVGEPVAADLVIYVSKNGNDGNQATTPTTPAAAVKTLNAALDYAEKLKISEIRILDEVIIDSDLNFSPVQALNIMRNAGNKNTLITIKNGTNVTFQNVTIDGMEQYSTGNGGLIHVESGATLTLDSGTVLQNGSAFDGGAIYSSGHVKFQNTKTTLAAPEIKNNVSFNQGGGLFVTGASSSLEIHDGKISGNQAIQGGGVCVVKVPSLKMVGGAIERNISIGSGTSGGGLLVVESKFYMSGGQINNNKSKNNGGGVYLETNSHFNMNGGDIYENTTENYGGGVFVNGSKFTLNDGKISKNTSHGNGAGVAINEQYHYNIQTKQSEPLQSSTFTMTGGSISFNQSDKGGGGVYTLGDCEFIMNGPSATVDSNTAGSGGGIYISAGTSGEIYAGRITNNLSTSTESEIFGGGGIFVEGFKKDKGKLTLQNVLITANTAAKEGSGLAACPTAVTRIKLNKGSAIYNNVGNSDLYLTSTFGPLTATPSYDISEWMLGNVPYLWQDNNGEVPLNRLSGTLANNEEIIWKASNPSNQGVQDIRNLAKVIITGNSSASNGGGIATNGILIIGDKEETVDIRITKLWKDNAKNIVKHPESVKVAVYAKGKYVGHENLRKDQNWKLEIKNLVKNLPEFGDLAYTIKEAPVNGYSSEVTGDMQHGFTLTNTLTPEPEPEPEPNPEPEPEPEPEPTPTVTPSEIIRYVPVVKDTVVWRNAQINRAVTPAPSPVQEKMSKTLLPKTGEERSSIAYTGLALIVSSVLLLALRKKLK